MNKIYLDADMVPANLRGGYTGKKFAAVVCTEVTIPADAGLWSEGSRDQHSCIDFATGEQRAFPGQGEAPWGNRQALTVALVPGVAVVKHTMLQGKDLGLTFFVHPDNAAKWLLAPVAELSDHEKLVLLATCNFKASYGGKDRYTMMMEDERCHATPLAPFPTREQWDTAKQALIARGFLNKAGAVTPAGRNARPPR